MLVERVTCNNALGIVQRNGELEFRGGTKEGFGRSQNNLSVSALPFSFGGHVRRDGCEKREFVEKSRIRGRVKISNSFELDGYRALGKEHVIGRAIKEQGDCCRGHYEEEN